MKMFAPTPLQPDSVFMDEKALAGERGRRALGMGAQSRLVSAKTALPGLGDERSLDMRY